MQSRVYASVGRPSVRPSVFLSVRLSHPAAARRCREFVAVGPAAGDIDRLLHGPRAGGQQQPRRSTAHSTSSKCG